MCSSDLKFYTYADILSRDQKFNPITTNKRQSLMASQSTTYLRENSVNDPNAISMTPISPFMSRRESLPVIPLKNGASITNKKSTKFNNTSKLQTKQIQIPQTTNFQLESSGSSEDYESSEDK